MTEPTIAPYGTWVSPIDAADLAAGGHAVTAACFVGEEIWWLEQRPAEGGRSAVRREGENGEPVDVLPAPWNARSRVHEYGGGSWAVTEGGDLVFTELTDQRLYLLRRGDEEPEPLTDEGARFGDLSIARLDGADHVLAVRETHGEAIVRDVVAVPLEGGAPRRLAGGSDFVAAPRVSPDGTRLVWIAWDHPRMPWDGTELRIATADEGGPSITLLGGARESVLQPEWLDDDTLAVISDRSGWWNLYRVRLEGTLDRLHPDEAEYGGPLWMLGTRWFETLDDGRLLAVRNAEGVDELAIIGTDGTRTPVETPLTTVQLAGRQGDTVLLLGGSDRLATGLRRLDLATGALAEVRLGVEDLPDAGYLPRPVARALPGVGGRTVHALVAPPRNPEFVAPEGERPPYVAFVHGGPTAQSRRQVNLAHAYFTSRGFGIIDVNYGGSTGYGRAYRERLRGQWGVVDVEDVVAAVTALAESGEADPKRLLIRGGSAGGWTVLSALTSSDVFAAGTSYYGVAELSEFAATTHDFESRYVDGLVGPREDETLYRDRAPVHRVGRGTSPVLLLQGLEDPVVPPRQAEVFRDALVAQGIPHGYVAYEGESHGFRRAETVIHSLQAELSFYGQVLGFEVPGVPEFMIERL